LYDTNHKELKEVVDFDTLYAGAKLAKSEHEINVGLRPDGIHNMEWEALQHLHSKAWWRAPKHLLLTLSACFLASFSQGWIQVCTGNAVK
jgi:hypothetical protein